MAHRWRYPRNMARRFTYKELTLILGVVVAFIVILTLWLRQPLESFFDASYFPGTSQIEMLKKEIVDTYVSAFAELVSGRSNPY